MHLDVPTLFWILTMAYAANLVFAIVLYLARYRFPGAGLWILAQSLVALGMVIVTQRTEQTPFVWAVVTNTVLFGASVVYAHAALSFRRPGTFSLAWYGVCAAFAVLFALLQGAPFNARVIVFSIAGFFANLAVFFIFCYRSQVQYRFASWITGIPFLLIAIGNVLRIPDQLFGNHLHSIHDQGDVSPIIYLFSILTASVSLFGYYLLSGVRFETVIKDQSAELLRQNESLIRADKNRDLFMSALAHDLRAPISGAARYVNKFLLAENVNLNDKRSDIQVLAVSLEKTNTFLENMLWWTRSQHESWELEPVLFPVMDAMQEVRDIMLPEAESKGIALLLETEMSTEPLLVYADLQSVELILRNLVSNALKFTEAGKSVRLSCQRDGDMALVSVSDEGSGIESELLSRLFDFEHKITSEGTSGESGSGLGLLLCRTFAQRNGGTLTIESEAGKGTVVWVRLPGASSALLVPLIPPATI